MILSARLKWHLLLIFMTVVWGASFFGTRQALLDLSASQIIASRFFVAYLVMCIWSRIVLPRDSGIALRDWPRVLFMSLVQPIGYFYFETAALQHTSSVNVASVVALSPVTIALAAHLFLKERPTLWFYPGLLLSVGGVGVALAAGGAGLRGGWGIGETLALCACLLVAVYMLFARRLSTRYSAIAITRFQMGFTSLFFAGAALLTGYRVDVLAWQHQTWLALVLLGIFASAFGYLGLNLAYQRLPARHVGLVCNFIPVVTMLLTPLFPGGEFRLGQWVGIGIALIGLTLCVWEPVAPAAERELHSSKTPCSVRNESMLPRPPTS